MTVLFLYTELADYFIACCNELSRSASVHIVRWPVNKEAPFRFNFSDSINVYDKNEYTRSQLNGLIDAIKPDVIVCSGWIDKDYLVAVKPWFNKIPTVITCDTHWKGSIKQYAATILSRLVLKNRFSHIWVPGKPQYTYAQKLGFKPKQIRTGFYSCDLAKFNAIYNKYRTQKENSFPKVLLYVGRYYEFKGITDLWTAFSSLNDNERNDWELWCLGSGSIPPVQHPHIKHFGFVQPKDLEPLISKAGVFVLPSRFEPWGVVVHEYAAAGFPLLISEEVGASEAFLQEGKNGFLFPKENSVQLAETIKKVLSLNSAKLNEMAQHSHLLAQTINPSQWASTIKQIYDDHR